MYGEARIINTATGLAAGYSTDDLHTVANGNPNFNDVAGPDGGPLNRNKVISWFQEPTVSATFYVLPLGTERAMAFDGNVSATYQVEGAYNIAPSGVLGHYNNNEQFQSSTARAPVTCLGLISRADLLGPLNASFSANGGWGNFVNTDVAQNSLVYKYESTSALGGAASFINRAPVK